VDDLADAHLRALSKLQQGSPELVCNLGTGNGFSVREVIEAARRITGHAIPARITPRRAGDPSRLVSGGTRARELLGWTPRTTAIEDIVSDAWRFHRAFPNGYSF
jgi:UDP-glucose 4-epimerase